MGFLLFTGATLAGPAYASAPPAPVFVPTYQVTLTGYNAVPEQTDDSPFETASGAYTNPEIIAARSRDLASELPFGTIIAIETVADTKNCGYSKVAPLIGYRVIEDTMNARYENYIDVLFAYENGRNPANLLGVCKGVTIHVVGHIKSLNAGKLPRSQKDLVAIVKGKPSQIALK